MDNFFIWTLNDIIWIVVVSIIIVVTIILSALRWIKQTKCSHKNVFENGACDAICRDCGKNLGFIGTWKKRQK